MDGGREVIFYNSKRRRVVFNPEYSISEIEGVCSFAKFGIKSNDKMTKNIGKVYLIDGNLTSIEYKNPTEHADVFAIDKIDIVIVEKPLVE
jgi:hypothetical protein